MVVILLNFLIAIVNEAHHDASHEKFEKKYQQQSEYNQELETIEHLMHIRKVPGDLFVIAANFDEKHSATIDNVITAV